MLDYLAWAVIFGCITFIGFPIIGVFSMVNQHSDGYFDYMWHGFLMVLAFSLMFGIPAALIWAIQQLLN